jgi:hypothetical protein
MLNPAGGQPAHGDGGPILRGDDLPDDSRERLGYIDGNSEGHA